MPATVALSSHPDVYNAAVGAIFCGSEHSMLVTRCGAICVFGWNEHGNLGLGDMQNRCAPVWLSPAVHEPAALSDSAEARVAGIEDALLRVSVSAPLLAVGGAATLGLFAVR